MCVEVNILFNLERSSGLGCLKYIIFKQGKHCVEGVKQNQLWFPTHLKARRLCCIPRFETDYSLGSLTLVWFSSSLKREN